MSSRMRAVVAMSTLALVLVTCGQAPALATGPKPGPNAGCPLSLLEGTLHGDASDAHLAWLMTPYGERRELEWPWGFTARFVPNLEVLAPNGAVVAKEGDDLDLGGAGALRSHAFAICEVNGTIYLDA